MDKYKTIGKESLTELEEKIHFIDKNKEIEIINYDCILNDIFTYLYQPIYLREGFKEIHIENQNIDSSKINSDNLMSIKNIELNKEDENTKPNKNKYLCNNFFIKINGNNNELSNYLDIDNSLFCSKNFKEYTVNINNYINQHSEYDKTSKNLVKNDFINLKEFDIENNNLLFLTLENQNRFFNIIENYLFNSNLKNSEKFELIYMLITLPSCIIDKINQFKIDKINPIIIFKENSEIKTFKGYYHLLHLFKILNLYGFDVIIWNTKGRAGAENLLEIPIINVENEMDINNKENENKCKKHNILRNINRIFLKKELLPLLISSFGVGFFMIKIIISITTSKTNELLYDVIITLIILILETITIFLYSNKSEYPFIQSLKHYFSTIFIFSTISMILIMLVCVIIDIIFVIHLYLF